jgi:hypothetical protein
MAEYFESILLLHHFLVCCGGVIVKRKSWVREFAPHSVIIAAHAKK